MFFGLEKTQLKTNTAFTRIDNAGWPGDRAAHSSSFELIILDSVLNIITGEMRVSHVQRGAGAGIHPATVGRVLNPFPRIPVLRFDFPETTLLISRAPLCYTERT